MAEAPSDETRRYSKSGFLKRTGAGTGALALSDDGAAANNASTPAPTPVRLRKPLLL